QHHSVNAFLDEGADNLFLIFVIVLSQGRVPRQIYVDSLLEQIANGFLRSRVNGLPVLVQRPLRDARDRERSAHGSALSWSYFARSYATHPSVSISHDGESAHARVLAGSRGLCKPTRKCENGAGAKPYDGRRNREGRHTRKAWRGRELPEGRGDSFRVARQSGELGAPELDLADVVRPGLLRDRNDVHGGVALRRGALWSGSISRLAATVGFDDHRGTRFAEDGARHQAALRADARAQVGDFDGGVRHVRRRLQQQRGCPGREPGDSCRRLRARVPAAPRSSPLREHPASKEDRRRPRQLPQVPQLIIDDVYFASQTDVDPGCNN